MQSTLGSLLVLVGAAFVLMGAVGLVRLPDFFLRTSAVTKAATLGLGLLLGGTAVHAGVPGLFSRAIAIFVFVLLTTPVAGHVLGRAAYRAGVPLWFGTGTDEVAAPTTHQTPVPPALAPKEVS